MDSISRTEPGTFWIQCIINAVISQVRYTKIK